MESRRPTTKARLATAVLAIAAVTIGGWMLGASSADGQAQPTGETVLWGPERVTVGHDGTAAASFFTEISGIGSEHIVVAEAWLHGAGVVWGLVVRVDGDDAIVTEHLETGTRGVVAHGGDRDTTLDVEVTGEPGTKVNLRLVAVPRTGATVVRDVVPVPPAETDGVVAWERITLQIVNGGDTARPLRVGFVGGSRAEHAGHLGPGQGASLEIMPGDNLRGVLLESRTFQTLSNATNVLLTFHRPDGTVQASYLDVWERPLG